MTPVFVAHFLTIIIDSNVEPMDSACMLYDMSQTIFPLASVLANAYQGDNMSVSHLLSRELPPQGINVHLLIYKKTQGLYDDSIYFFVPRHYLLFCFSLKVLLSIL